MCRTRSAAPWPTGNTASRGRPTTSTVNVFVTDEQLDPVFEALRSLGIAVDESAAHQGAAKEGLFIVHLGPYRIDVFTPSIEFSWEAQRTRVQHDCEGQAVWFLSAEALCVFKLLFFRGKDLVDLERLVAVQGATIDRNYVRLKIAEMMGGDDSRVDAWDRLWSEHSPA